MHMRRKIALGMALGAGAAWTAKAWLRSRRRIDLAGRVVLITGGTSGHGFVVACLAAARGSKVVLAARNPGELRAAEEDLRQRGARDVLAVPTDVAEADQARALVARTLDRFGRLDVLVNNAGIISVGPLESMTLDDFQRAMAVNFWGAVHTAMAALPVMRAQGFGRIANVSSIGGLIALPHLLPYTASKFALTGFTEGLRAELAGDGILVTGIYPSTMRTGGHTHAWLKGDKDKEYAWFGISDTHPWLAVPAERVARRLLDAVCHGDARVVVGWPAHVAQFMHNTFPEWVLELSAVVAKSLPSSNDPTPAVQGQHLHGKVADMLNRAVPPSSRPGTA